MINNGLENSKFQCYWWKNCIPYANTINSIKSKFLFVTQKKDLNMISNRVLLFEHLKIWETWNFFRFEWRLQPTRLDFVFKPRIKKNKINIQRKILFSKRLKIFKIHCWSSIRETVVNDRLVGSNDGVMMPNVKKVELRWDGVSGEAAELKVRYEGCSEEPSNNPYAVPESAIFNPANVGGPGPIGPIPENPTDPRPPGMSILSLKILEVNYQIILTFKNCLFSNIVFRIPRTRY